MAQLRGRPQDYQHAQPARATRGPRQSSLTDPDRRSLPTGPGVDGCYNGAVVGDAKHKRIGTHARTRAVTEPDHLAPLAPAAKAVRGGAEVDAGADKGFAGGAPVKECAA